MNRNIIFLGPSLPLAEAKAILPDAYYLPPVHCGDMISVLRLKPTLIGIIDGYFENIAAVWHKEILYALEQGVQVIGGSSMGALRASELANFGMQVVGKVATDYLSGVINDDDEVAVLHGLEDSCYAPLTDAMVNIRATLEYAITDNVIDNPLALLILEAAKQLFYQERTLAKAIAMLTENSIQPQLEKLKLWLKQSGYINAKKEDALLVLKTICSLENLPPKLNSFKTNKPTFFRSLQKNRMCRPFTHYHDWLPIQEKVALAARYLDSSYRLTRRLAYVLAACYELALEKNINPTPTQLNEIINQTGFSLPQAANSSAWDEQNDCHAADKTKFLLRLAKIRALLEQEKQLNDIATEPLHYFLILIKLSGEYLTYKQKVQETLVNKDSQDVQLLNLFNQHNPTRFHLINCFAECWWFIERQALRLGLNPTPQMLQEYSDNLRLTHKLYTQSLTEQWLMANDLDGNAYQALIAANTRLSILIIQNNADVLFSSMCDHDIWWLLDALWLTGVYQEAKSLLYHPNKLAQLKRTTKEEKSDLESYALAHDFVGGEQDFMGKLETYVARTLEPSETGARATFDLDSPH